MRDTQMPCYERLMPLLSEALLLFNQEIKTSKGLQNS